MRVVVIEDGDDTEEYTHIEDEDEEVQPLPVVEVTCPFPYPNPYPEGTRYKWCGFCDRKFRSELGINQHMRADHPKKLGKKEASEKNLETIQCSLCNFSRKCGSMKHGWDVLREHRKNEHKEEEVKKEEAKRAKLRLKREEELQKAKADVILCRSCDFQADPLYWRDSMKKHMKEEHENQEELVILQFSDEVEGERYSCRLCSQSTSSYHPPYRNTKVLRKHLKMKHGIGRAPLPCPVCGMLRGSSGLKRSGSLDILCFHCSVAACNSSKLKVTNSGLAGVADKMLSLLDF